MILLYFIDDEIKGPRGEGPCQGLASYNQRGAETWSRAPGSRPHAIRLHDTHLPLPSSGPNLTKASSLSAASDSRPQALPRAQKTCSPFPWFRSGLLSLTLLQSPNMPGGLPPLPLRVSTGSNRNRQISNHIPYPSFPPSEIACRIIIAWEPRITNQRSGIEEVEEMCPHQMRQGRETLSY